MSKGGASGVIAVMSRSATLRAVRRSPLIILLLLAAPALAAPKTKPAPKRVKKKKRVPAGGLAFGGVAISPSGVVTKSGRTLGKLPLPPPPRSLSVHELSVRGQPLLHVRVAGRDGRAGELVVGRSGKPLVFAGSTGPRGVDGEHSRHLSLTKARVLLYERRDGVVRCDGKPSYLFPRLYDFARQRFRLAAPSRPKMPGDCCGARYWSPLNWTPFATVLSSKFCEISAG